MRVVTRLVGLWILAGATMKLLYGTPADLPALAREGPLSLSLTFKLIIAIELVVGILALLRPSIGWVPALALLLAFIGVLAVQVSQGEASCGCFGGSIQVKPSSMLAIDVGMLLLLVVSQPWRRQRRRLEVPWLWIFLLSAGALALPWVLNREATDGTPVTSGGWVAFDKNDVGKALSDTTFGRALPQAAHIADGLVIVYSDGCEVCAEHLRTLAIVGAGGRSIVLLRKPDDPDHPQEKKVDVKPEGPDVVDVDLSPEPEIAVTPPLHLEVVGGKVVKALEGMEVSDAARGR